MSHIYNILIVDDSTSARVAIKKLLNKAGYQVTEAENGKDALLLAQHTQFDLVITDINMSDMGGIEFVKELRDSNKYQKTPVLTLASAESPEEEIELRNANIIHSGFTSSLADIPIDVTMNTIH